MKELWELYSAFFRIGICTFGGGYAMLPMLEREVVKKHSLATMDELLDYFAIGQCTPGVIAVNTATFIGYKRRGVTGGIAATLGVITPSIIIITVIAALLVPFMDNEYVRHAFVGIRIAVCALIGGTVIKLVKKACRNPWQILLTVAAFILAAFAKVNTIYIIVVVIAGAVAWYFLFGKKAKNS